MQFSVNEGRSKIILNTHFPQIHMMTLLTEEVHAKGRVLTKTLIIPLIRNNPRQLSWHVKRRNPTDKITY